MKKVWHSIILLIFTFFSAESQTSTLPVKEIVTTDEQVINNSVPVKSYTNPDETTILSSVKKGKYTFQVIKEADGSIRKRVPELENRLRLSKERTLRNYPPETYIFHESFEDYPGEDRYWLPEGWERESKVGNIPDPIRNLCWHTTAGGVIVPRPTHGIYEAYSHGSMGAYNESQDEWLITPYITPGPHDALIFDAGYSLFFMFYDYKGTSNFINPFNTLQVMIYTDETEAWNVLWDASEGGYNEENIINYYESKWNHIQVPLTEYQGQNVRFAFRLVGTDAQSTTLDNIFVGIPIPQITYDLPGEFFFGGFNANMQAAYGAMQGPAYLPITWKYNFPEATSPEWTMPETGSEETYISNEESLSDIYPFGSFFFPTLTAEYLNMQAIPYYWGVDENVNFEKSIFFTGGNYGENIHAKDAAIPEGMGVGTYNILNKVNSYRSPTDKEDYTFGTRKDKKMDALINVFDKPAQPYLLNKVMIHTAALKVQKNDQLNLYITRNRGENTDTLAMSFWRAKQDMNENKYTLEFSEFTCMDEDGFEEMIENLVIEDEIAVELTGFNKEDVLLSVYTESLHDNLSDNHAFVYILQDDKRVLMSAPEYILKATSLCFSLDITFSFIGVPSLDYHFEAAEEGGSHSWEIESWLPPSSWISTDMPDWIKSEISEYSETDKTVEYTLTADPLPANAPSRSATITLKDSIGGECHLTVNQSSSTDVGWNSNLQNTNETIVKYSPGQVDLTFEAGIFDILEIYSAMGQKMKEYPVSDQKNTISVPSKQFNKGIYIFKLTGNKTDIFKIIF